MSVNNIKWVVKPLVPEEVYTDRAEFLEYFYNAALNAARRRTRSTVLLGQRRMGKTEIFKRVVNRLFFEQDPRDPNAVAPVYFSFPDGKTDNRRFAKKYIENFMRYYVGFYTSCPELVRDAPKEEELITRIREARASFPFSGTLDRLLKWHEAIVEKGVYLPEEDAVEIPRRISDVDDSTIVMFLDEFQNTRLPQYEFDIAGFMQNAVESPTCPHFVTGSAMSILAREIIGRGSLFGRFRGKDIEAMSIYFGAELALKAADYFGAVLPEVMAPVVAERCGGNPFYINAVIQQAAEMKTALSDAKTLNAILAVDITSGFIWGELNDQVTRWIERVNEHKITKWVLYLSALEENEDKSKRNRLDLERIQGELKKREGSDVPLEAIRDVLIKLSRGDLLEYLELGDWFRRVKDPILLEFLKVWGKIEVEGSDKIAIRDGLRKKYYHFSTRSLNEYKGYLAEVHMSQVLLSAENRVLDKEFFNASEDVEIPDFTFVHHHVRLNWGKGREIDVLGGAGIEQWVCQSKFVRGSKIGISVLRNLESQADAVMKDKEPNLVRMWLFANYGLTGQAKAFAKERGILWSSRREFNELLQHLGLRELPDL